MFIGIRNFYGTLIFCIIMITFGFRHKYSGVIRAAIAVLIGCIMIIRPGSSLIFLVKVIAAILVASGIVSLVYGLVNRRAGGLGLMIFNTIVNILIGVLIFSFPEEVAGFVTILIGIALIVFGLFQIVAMASAASFVVLGFWTFILPVMCTLGGTLVLLNPFGTASTLTLIAGIAVLVYGISELFSSWKMARAMHEYEIKFPSSEPGATRKGKDGIDYSSAKDAEFEKADDK